MNDSLDQKTTVILEVGAEGGALTIEGRRDHSGAWRFRYVRDERTLDDLLPGEFSADDLYETSRWVSTLDEAVASIDRWPWARLYALRVHPDFAAQILEVVRARLQTVGAPERSRLWDRWREVVAAGHRDRATRASRRPHRKGK